jgi:hypothetical protein
VSVLKELNMLRLGVCVLLAGFVLAAVSVSDVAAQKKKLEVSKKWDGTVEDEKAMKPDVIVSAKGFEAVWKAWKIGGEVPKVDFDKNVVVAVYSVGSKLNLAGVNLNEKGNLEALGFGTRDIQPGFRFVLGVVSKDGVKTVNGKELPKE